MFQPSHSPSYRNDEEYLQPRKPQITTRLPQFSNYAKENLVQTPYSQTIKKKPQIFESMKTSQNVSPIRHIQFKVSHIPTVSPLRSTTDYRQHQMNLTPQRYIINNPPKPVYTPQKHQPQPQSQPQYQQQQQQSYTPRQQQQQIPSQLIQQQSIPQQSCNVISNRPSQTLDQSQVNITQSNVNSIYTCLQDELSKSELKLQQLQERSKLIQEQRRRLQDNFKNKYEKSPCKY